MVLVSLLVLGVLVVLDCRVPHIFVVRGSLFFYPLKFIKTLWIKMSYGKFDSFTSRFVFQYYSMRILFFYNINIIRGLMFPFRTYLELCYFSHFLYNTFDNPNSETYLPILW